ncbi:hypothetical protein [Trinickia diaoshuihuensis]|uniref:hypothetical protein n=1 Tax=Trinickia diaoshuihuensis TaxID=2292265 RepID=UPI000E252F3F|nr:hypothetical protein [Trinickia diaoshuihuensis]
MTVLLANLAAAAQQPTLWFHLPGGAAIAYSNATNAQDPLPQRTWNRAVFYLPNGATFSLLPRAGESNEGGGTQMEPPSDDNISPSGQYVVVARDEQGAVSTGPGQPESVLGREYCSMIEIRTGCITADQTGEICRAGWRAGQPAQWGTDDQTDLMLKSDRPSASRQLGFINAGQPPKLTIRDDSGADNLLRCDPPSPGNREIYRKIATALDAAGVHYDARLISNSLSKTTSNPGGMPVPAPVESEHRTANVSVQKATLYTAPDDASASRAYLVRNDVITVLKQFPVGWAYADYVNASGKHLLRWIKADEIAIKP